MTRILQVFRLFKINRVLMRYAFTRHVLGPETGAFRLATYFNPYSFISKKESRGESIRVALEKLGPIFVKFGQLLSTHPDMLPEDIIIELSKLQDRVPPFSSKQVKKIIEDAFKQRIEDRFVEFDEVPLASASIAQVHAARLHDGSDVVVKVLRPKILKTIQQDISLLYFAAKLAERFWAHGKRLHLVGLVAEFEMTILDELDLMREAANASQLRRNFINSEMMYVPKIYWQYTRPQVMVMERIYGVSVSNIPALKNANTDMKKLAEYGVEIFFTQVFRDSFFHADMHPGNVFVDISDPQNPRYIGVDFGIMGTLNPSDQRYLAENLLAFFHRDYRRVAILHVESGWVPPDTRIDQFESAIRTVSEPIFERPIKDISFGQLLLRLFQTAERFQMEVQPQLMLLQKTLLSIEGLGRQLYPELDLWSTAKPFMVRWMREQRGIKKLFKESFDGWQDTAAKMLKTPELFYEVLQHIQQRQNINKYEIKKVKVSKSKKRKRIFWLGAGIVTALIWGINLLAHNILFVPSPFGNWLLPSLSALLILVGLVR